ncbi:putative iron-only hydrogenase system regulator [Olsenella profusa DSM 13989]|uniref:Putative iron-only hydrogenase system regulator n=1 Tax=Olsenella profusa F0195 TaxID=1125712 RepID=U2TJD1_9ACTN|nr:TM1266 family iron-only hydrogenase system putative regulator [Olsenella profusa]ERL06288.1 putative iron-only hydrogenase system regulator [Olsenella profusa F0195]MDP9858744.1 putative iron-only hydrogenase system regulator [Olsenella profusa DSM 13989]
MQSRVAVIGIIVEDPASVEALNELLHEFADIIIGRMGIPYHRRDISVISIAVDAPQDRTSALTGRIGALDGVSCRTAFSNLFFDAE